MPELTVLFVCTGNICRSAYAEVVAHHRLGGAEGVRVASAGTWGLTDSPMCPDMAELARARGADPSGFRARRITRGVVEASDLILVAEATHRAFILEDWPAALPRVFSLVQFARAVADAPGSGRGLVAAVKAARLPLRMSDDITDPYRRGPEAARACALQVDAALDAILPRLAE